MTPPTENRESVWIGVLPDSWRTVRNKQLLFELSELSPDGAEELLSVSHITGITPRSEKRVTMIEAESLEGYRLVEPGDLVINMMWAWMGALGMSRHRGIVSPAYSVYRPKPGVMVDTRYFDYLYRSDIYVMEITRHSRGIHSSRLRIYPNAFLNLRVPQPPIETQRAIADYLDRETARIDTLIEEQQRLIEMLRERRLSVVRSAVPDPRSSSVAADKLGRRTRIGNGSTPNRDNTAFWDGGHIPWLNSSVVNQARVSGATQFVTEVAASQCHLPLVPPGSILVALTGQGKTRGTTTILDIEATINQHMAYITPDGSFWDSEYLKWGLTAAYVELRAMSDENGSTKGALTCEELKQFRVAHPPLDKQRHIVAYLDEQTAKLDALVVDTQRFIELSRERRSALITAAVTGQFDVREVA